MLTGKTGHIYNNRYRYQENIPTMRLTNNYDGVSFNKRGWGMQSVNL